MKRLWYKKPHLRLREMGPSGSVHSTSTKAYSPKQYAGIGGRDGRGIIALSPLHRHNPFGLLYDKATNGWRDHVVPLCRYYRSKEVAAGSQTGC